MNLPRTSNILEGHTKAERQFVDSWSGRCVHHAWLLCGPPGIGKATMAYRMARFVLSAKSPASAQSLFSEPDPLSLDVSPEHPIFRHVANNTHPDLLVIERKISDKKGQPKDEISVAEVRSILPFLRLTSTTGGWRVVILDGADYINSAGQNALLKILEEPPPKTLLLLTAENVGHLLPTVRSRARVLPLNPLPVNIINRLLQHYIPEATPEERLTLASMCRGSIGSALLLHRTSALKHFFEVMRFAAQFPAVPWKKTHDWAENLTRSGQEETYAAVTNLWVEWCTDFVQRAVTEDREESPFDEFELLFLSLSPLESWIKMRDRLQSLFDSGNLSHLDRKQILLKALWLMTENFISG